MTGRPRGRISVYIEDVNPQTLDRIRYVQAVLTKVTK